MKKFILAGVALAVVCAAVYAVHPGPADGVTPGQKGAAEGRRPRPKMSAHHLLRIAMIAAKRPDDAQLQALVDKAIADRKAMITAESARVNAMEALINAVRGGDE